MSPPDRKGYFNDTNSEDLVKKMKKKKNKITLLGFQEKQTI